MSVGGAVPPERVRRGGPARHRSAGDISSSGPLSQRRRAGFRTRPGTRRHDAARFDQERTARRRRAAGHAVASGRRTCARTSGALSRDGSRRTIPVRRDRRRRPDRRSNRTARRDRERAAGSRHIPRHRHLRRQHRDTRWAAAGHARVLSASRAGSRRAGSIVVLVGLCAGRDRRAVGLARHAHGGAYLRGAPSIIARQSGRPRPSPRRHGRRASTGDAGSRVRADVRSDGGLDRGRASRRGARAARSRGPGVGVASVVASLAVEAALLPVSAQAFSRVTSAGLLLNLLAVPMMGVVQIAALIVTVADAFADWHRRQAWVRHSAAADWSSSANAGDDAAVADLARAAARRDV